MVVPGRFDDPPDLLDLLDLPDLPDLPDVVFEKVVRKICVPD